MAGFVFSLADGVSLKAAGNDFFLISRTPVKILRINGPLYRLLERISRGEPEARITSPDVQKILLSLAVRGYLKLTGIAPLTDFPLVTVIVPVRDSPEDLRDCLQSLGKLDYPRDKLEIIVVDDGSREAVTAPSPDIKVIRHEIARGAAAARNTSAQNARGEILAFLDADCLAGEGWLKELVPFIQSAVAGAVGGYIDGCATRTPLDRYEKTFSSLNLGKRLLIEGKSESGFYVPSASLLVTREAFNATGGFREGMRVGEDVDFCWRLRDKGYTLVYAPYGSVAHKHRGSLGAMLKRRSQYGMSEAVLYRAHRVKRKGLAFVLFPALLLLALALALLLWNPYPLVAVLPLFAADVWQKSAAVKKYRLEVTLPQLAMSALRTQLSFSYYILFHLVRYYLVVFIGIGFAWHPCWYFGAAAVDYTSVVDFVVKKPALLYPAFLGIYLLEHLAYQAGVFWGCVKQGWFGAYRVVFKRS